MATNPFAFNQVAAALVGCSLEDEHRIESFYKRDILTYPRPVQAWIFDFLMLQHYRLTLRELGLLKRVVARWTAHLRKTPHVSVAIPGAVAAHWRERLQAASTLPSGPATAEEWTWYKISVAMDDRGVTNVDLDAQDIRQVLFHSLCITAPAAADGSPKPPRKLQAAFIQLEGRCEAALESLAAMKVRAHDLRTSAPRWPNKPMAIDLNSGQRPQKAP